MTNQEAFDKIGIVLEKMYEKYEKLESRVVTLEDELRRLREEHEKRFPSKEVIEDLKKQIK